MFLACYADNLTDFDLSSLIDFHRQGGVSATLTRFPRPAAVGVRHRRARRGTTGGWVCGKAGASCQ